ENWWGSNGGPAADDVAGAAVSTWLQLRVTADPEPVAVNENATLTADLLGRNTGQPLGTGALAGLPTFAPAGGTIFANPQLGTLPNADTQFVDGRATAVFQAGGSGGTGSVDATADAQTVTEDV